MCIRDSTHTYHDVSERLSSPLYVTGPSGLSEQQPVSYVNVDTGNTEQEVTTPVYHVGSETFSRPLYVNDPNGLGEEQPVSYMNVDTGNAEQIYAVALDGPQESVAYGTLAKPNGVILRSDPRNNHSSIYAKLDRSSMVGHSEAVEYEVMTPPSTLPSLSAAQSSVQYVNPVMANAGPKSIEQPLAKLDKVDFPFSADHLTSAPNKPLYINELPAYDAVYTTPDDIILSMHMANTEA